MKNDRSRPNIDTTYVSLTGQEEPFSGSYNVLLEKYFAFRNNLYEKNERFSFILYKVKHDFHGVCSFFSKCFKSFTFNTDLTSCVKLYENDSVHFYARTMMKYNTAVYKTVMQSANKYVAKVHKLLLTASGMKYSTRINHFGSGCFFLIVIYCTRMEQ